jgi:hypothetical protein
MRLEMTDGELAMVRKVIRRHEKQSRWWKFSRWALPIVGVIFLGCAAISFILAQWLVSNSFGVFYKRTHEQMAAIPATRADIAAVRTGAATDAVLCSFLCMLSLYFGSLGCYLFVFPLITWNRDKEHIVSAKLLRLLTEQPAEIS